MRLNKNWINLLIWNMLHCHKFALSSGSPPPFLVQPSFQLCQRTISNNCKMAKNDKLNWGSTVLLWPMQCKLLTDIKLWNVVVKHSRRKATLTMKQRVQLLIAFGIKTGSDRCNSLVSDLFVLVTLGLRSWHLCPLESWGRRTIHDFQRCRLIMMWQHG